MKNFEEAGEMAQSFSDLLPLQKPEFGSRDLSRMAHITQASRDPIPFSDFCPYYIPVHTPHCTHIYNFESMFSEK